MEFEIVTIVMACGVSFALGMYVSSQIMKDVNKRTTDKYFNNRNKHIEDITMSVPDGLEFNKPYNIDAIPEHIKIKEDQLMMEEEARMNIIGQNGNDGLHYEEEVDYPRTGGLAPDCGPGERDPKWLKDQYNRNREHKDQK
tara:strand:+ start:1264 stop:1686 length:423 start_codon:yes stop_codon:yes gene_type:complete